jgi:hypothetical protein
MMEKIRVLQQHDGGYLETIETYSREFGVEFVMTDGKTVRAFHRGDSLLISYRQKNGVERIMNFRGDMDD